MLFSCFFPYVEEKLFFIEELIARTVRPPPRFRALISKLPRFSLYVKRSPYQHTKMYFKIWSLRLWKCRISNLTDMGGEEKGLSQISFIVSYLVVIISICLVRLRGAQLQKSTRTQVIYPLRQTFRDFYYIHSKTFIMINLTTSDFYYKHFITSKIIREHKSFIQLDTSIHGSRKFWPGSGPNLNLT